MTEQDKILYAQVVAQIIIADAAITDDERAFLEKVMDRFELSPEARKSVFGGVNYGDDVSEKVGRLDKELREHLVAELQAAAGADGNVDKREARIIEEVRAALFFAT